MFNENPIGPRTKPWGTPYLTVEHRETEFFTETQNLVCDRCFVIPALLFIIALSSSFRN